MTLKVVIIFIIKTDRQLHLTKQFYRKVAYHLLMCIHRFCSLSRKLLFAVWLNNAGERCVTGFGTRLIVYSDGYCVAVVSSLHTLQGLLINISSEWVLCSRGWRSRVGL